MRKLLIALVLLAGTGLVGATGMETRPSITVTGNGKILYVPDVGYIQVGVSTEGWTAGEAWQKNEAIVKKIFEALKELGIEEKDIKTSNLNVQPRYQQRKDQEPKFLGYTVTYDLSVTCRKLDQMGALVDRMADAGANRNMSIDFGCSKLDELIDEARTKAVADARKKANLYVTGAGAFVGDVLAISDTPYYLPGRAYPVDAMALKEGKASLPIAAGEQELNVTVTISWAIENRHAEPAV